MAAGHRERGMGMGSHLLEKLQSDPDVSSRLYGLRNVNRDYDLPYLGGYSQDGKTIYLDRHLPDKVTIEEDGRKREIDPIPFLLAHEQFEKAVMDALGWSYAAAHEAATGYERRHVLQAGIPWRAYQNCMECFVKCDEHESIQRVPADLDMAPYYSPPADHALIAKMQDAMEGVNDGKQGKSEVDYAEGHPTSHCGPVAKWPKGACEHFEPPHGCCKVKGYIKNTGWCKLWESTNQ